MVGAIRTLDVVFHPWLTIRAFGWGVFFRAVLARHGDTFLSLLQQADCFACSPPNDARLVERCIALELQAKHVYQSLAERFGVSTPLAGFLDELACEEQDHADLLQVCLAAKQRGRRKAPSFEPWHDYVPLMEQRMQSTVASLDRVEQVEDVVRIIMEIESSEINRVFLGVLSTTRSRFVKRLRPFRSAVREHITYICRHLPMLAPGAMLACRELRVKYL